MFYDHIGQRNGVIVNAVNTQQTTQSTLNGDGGIVVGKFLYAFGNGFSVLPSLCNLLKINAYFTFLHSVIFSAKIRNNYTNQY
jgi:hypothetical protein